MTDRAIAVKAPAKLNLTFEILGLMDDGYHQVRSLMTNVAMADTLSFKIGSSAKSAETSISIHLLDQENDQNRSDFPLGADNLIARAIKLYLGELTTKTGIKSREITVSVTVLKEIPIGAGMAGGSADGAAALLAMNEYFEQALTNDELLLLGARLGADVPFCLGGGLRTGTGRGDLLSENLAAGLEELHMVIAKPTHLAISTPWAYKTWDQAEDLLPLHEKLKDRGISATPGDFALNNWREGKLTEAFKAFGNDFEQVVFPHYQQLKAIKQTFLKEGALACHMTGSGPTIFALAASASEAEALKLRFKAEYCKSEGIVCATKYDPIALWVTKTIDSGALICRE